MPTLKALFPSRRQSSQEATLLQRHIQSFNLNLAGSSRPPDAYPGARDPGQAAQQDEFVRVILRPITPGLN
jgi:hypothetical protein